MADCGKSETMIDRDERAARLAAALRDIPYVSVPVPYSRGPHAYIRASFIEDVHGAFDRLDALDLAATSIAIDLEAVARRIRAALEEHGLKEDEK